MSQPRSKYGNVRTEVDGITFHSRAEAQHYELLKLRLYAGEISDLTLQPRYAIWLNGQKICTYVADFEYLENGRRVVVDVKGHRTEGYKLKRRMMAAAHGIEVVEVEA